VLGGAGRFTLDRFVLRRLGFKSHDLPPQQPGRS
jgi:hypothetical protein